MGVLLTALLLNSAHPGKPVSVAKLTEKTAVLLATFRKQTTILLLLFLHYKVCILCTYANYLYAWNTYANYLYAWNTQNAICVCQNVQYTITACCAQSVIAVLLYVLRFVCLEAILKQHFMYDCRYDIPNMQGNNLSEEMLMMINVFHLMQIY